MSDKDMIGLVVAVTAASLLVRLLIANPMFGTKVNETAAKLF